MAKRKDVTKGQIVEAAGALLELRGFHGFSTRDLADEVGISSASLHHHFATKDALAAAVVARHRERVNTRLAEIAREVEGFAARQVHFHTALERDAGLLAMLAASFPTLPLLAQGEARQLFTNVQGWLTRFATQARSDGELPSDTTIERIAGEILSSLLGRALLVRMELPISSSMPPSTWAWQS